MGRDIQVVTDTGPLEIKAGTVFSVFHFDHYELEIPQKDGSKKQFTISANYLPKTFPIRV
ncbi:MAG: hypothetical protein HYV32_01840 [Candidatus Kerfeldbacteria bacterium]|nr:hypothetical protein [Candidatus Kerfeldbacteria bacterium]